MRHVILALFLLVFGTLRAAGCDVPDCSSDSDCDDGNPCTEDVCGGDYATGWEWADSDDFWSDLCSALTESDYRYCLHHKDDDGTSCEVEGQTGVCESGECRVEGEAPGGGI